MKELQELRNDILLLRNIGTISKEVEMVMLRKINTIEKQLITSVVSKSFTAKQVADMLVKDFSTIEEAIAYFDTMRVGDVGGIYSWYCRFIFKDDNLECYLTEHNNCKTFKELRRWWRIEKPNLKLLSAVRK